MPRFRRGIKVLLAIGIISFTSRVHAEKQPSGDAVIRAATGSELWPFRSAMAVGIARIGPCLQAFAG